MNNKYSLPDTLESILKENPDRNLLLNDYFRVPKENQEFLKQYNGAYSNVCIILGNLVLHIIWFLMTVIANILLSIIYVQHNEKFRKSIAKTENLFVSHATLSNIESNTDIYFEDIPNQIINNNKHVTILYLNHIRGNYLATLQKLSLKNNSSTTLLMPKFMKLKDYLAYLKFMLISIKDRAKLSREYTRIDVFKSRIILNSIKSLMKRQTYANYHLLMKFNLIQSYSTIDNIFLTLEGHSYEEEVIEQTIKVSPETKIWLRQHSPITLAQIGVFNILKALKKHVYILTTGVAYSNLFSKYSTNLSSFVIGTSKSRSVYLSPEKGNSVLIAPEGTESSTLDFLKFIYALGKDFSKFNFIFRIHPNLIANHKIRKQIRRNLSKNNFRLSSEPLEKDLSQTFVTLYRGSAVAIESLAFKNLPIYLNFDENSNLNVFSIVETDFPTLNDISDHSTLLRLLDSAKIASINSNIYPQLFESLNTIPISAFISKN